jgi:hypothetical protein
MSAQTRKRRSSRKRNGKTAHIPATQPNSRVVSELAEKDENADRVKKATSVPYMRR